MNTQNYLWYFNTRIAALQIYVQLNIIPDSSSDGLTYKIGNLGEDKCPSGYNYIQSLSACNDASNALLKKDSKGEKNIDNNVRLPYCWIGGKGNANYNPTGDSGLNGWKYSKLICEKSSKYQSYVTRKQ